MAKNSSEAPYWIVSEAALYAFFYYLQYILGADGNLWLNSIVLWVLINAAIIFCPVLRKCCK